MNLTVDDRLGVRIGNAAAAFWGAKSVRTTRMAQAPESEGFREYILSNAVVSS